MGRFVASHRAPGGSRCIPEEASGQSSAVVWSLRCGKPWTLSGGGPGCPAAMSASYRLSWPDSGSGLWLLVVTRAGEVPCLGVAALGGRVCSRAAVWTHSTPS